MLIDSPFLLKAIDETSSLYVWGNNKDGALGLGDEVNVEVISYPMLLKLPFKVVQAKAGGTVK